MNGTHGILVSTLKTHMSLAAPLCSQKLMLERMDPNTLGLMRKVKQLLDPNGIMNPGKLGMEGGVHG